MQNSTKLKPNWTLTTFFALVIVTILGNVILNHQNRESYNTVFQILYFIVGLMALISWLKTRDIYSFNFMIFSMLNLLFFGGYLESKQLKILCAVLLLLVLIFHFILLAKGKNQWLSPKIMDLAAKPIVETTDGFTGRPFPAGEIKFTKKQIKNFAVFMKKNMITFPHFQKDSISFVLLHFDHRLYWPFKTNYSKRTYVSFYYSGKVSVNIAKLDYQKYKYELAFYQLCESMGNLFKSFLSLYQMNKENEILNRIVG
jgi:Ca2+/Na+ antiporter